MDIEFTTATEQDVDAIVAMLADDELGSKRENYQQPLPGSYQRAFYHIDKNPNGRLVVAKINKQVVAVAQIDFITYLTYQGGARAQIEGVRVHKDFRSHGIGQQLFQHLIDLAKQRGCHMVQLTTNKQRPDAYRFYEQLGFVGSHEGFKLILY
ncbi:MAG: GNAT family N-acetyltransferase [Coxiellaceae bacterium]|nr:GNAT family N-acetyltransferase [Coxiellaceae bacterium]